MRNLIIPLALVSSGLSYGVSGSLIARRDPEELRGYERREVYGRQEKSSGEPTFRKWIFLLCDRESAKFSQWITVKRCGQCR